MKRRVIASVLGATSLLILSGCGSESEREASPDAVATPSSTASTTTAAATTTDGPVIVPFGQPLVGASGAEITIDSVEDIGGVTVVGILYTPGDTAIEGYNLLTPELTYGPKGVEAESDLSNSSDTFSGVIPPGTSKRLDWAYKVPLSELSSATMTVGIGLASPAWTGDLATFDPTVPLANPVVTPRPTTAAAPAETPSAAESGQIDSEELAERFAALEGAGAVPTDEAELLAGSICYQLKNGSSRDDVVALFTADPSVPEDGAIALVGIAIEHRCPEAG